MGSVMFRCSSMNAVRPSSRHTHLASNPAGELHQSYLHRSQASPDCYKTRFANGGAVASKRHWNPQIQTYVLYCTNTVFTAICSSLSALLLGSINNIRDHIDESLIETLARNVLLVDYYMMLLQLWRLVLYSGRLDAYKW
jgi:hypothetical protein